MLPVWLALVLGALSACDSFREPERYYDEAAHPPSVAALDLADLRAGQHLAGTVALTLDLDSLRGRVDRVVVAVDERAIRTLSSGLYAFELDTPSWPDGTHVLTVYIYLRGDNLGLPGLFDTPSYVLTTPLVFDQSVPPAPDVTLASWADGEARITWEESQAPNFYAYIIARDANWDYTSDGDFSVIDTVFDRSATTYVDTAMPLLYGARSDYRITAWNGAESSPYGAVGSAFVGTHLPEVQPTRLALFSAEGVVMLAVSEGDVVALQTATNELLYRIAPRDAGADEGQFAHLTPTPGGGRVYATMEQARPDGGPRYVVLDASTGEVVRIVDPPSDANSLAIGHDGRLYATAGGDLFVLDGETAAVLEHLPDLFSGTAGIIGATSDGTSVYVHEYRAGDPARRAVHRIDVTGGQPERAAVYELDTHIGGSGTEHYTRYFIAPNGRVYVRTNPGIEELDGETLQRLRFLDLQLEDERLVQFCVTADKLFVGLAPYIGSIDGRIAEYDLEGLTRLRTWDFLYWTIALNTSGRSHLYVSTAQNVLPSPWPDTGWAVSL